MRFGLHRAVVRWSESLPPFQTLCTANDDGWGWQKVHRPPIGCGLRYRLAYVRSTSPLHGRLRQTQSYPLETCETTQRFPIPQSHNRGRRIIAESLVQLASPSAQPSRRRASTTSTPPSCLRQHAAVSPDGRSGSAMAEDPGESFFVSFLHSLRFLQWGMGRRPWPCAGELGPSRRREWEGRKHLRCPSGVLTDELTLAQRLRV
jgi:hypothetical protein